jgi:hypothetical protein
MARSRTFRRAHAGAPDGAQSAPRFRPRLEWLEDRVQPGDTVLGLSTVALWSLGSSSFEVQELGWRASLFSSWNAADSPSVVSLRDFYATAVVRCQARAEPLLAASLAGAAQGSDFMSAGALVPFGQVAVHRLADTALVPSQALPMDMGLSGCGVGLWLGGVSSASSVLSSVGDVAGLTPPLLAAAPALSFDVSTGQLAIRPDSGAHTVREAPTTDGFVDIRIDGQDHSSDPSSASFDRALAGASSSTISGIRFTGGGQDTLAVGSQHLAGGFTIQASDGTVITENVGAAGPVTIEAPNISVNGSLYGSRIALVASGWVNVNAAGRINAQPSPGRAGRINPPIGIDVSAGVFVNSGQLHADGPSGGQINVQAPSRPAPRSQAGTVARCRSRSPGRMSAQRLLKLRSTA